jgi:two-component system NtrC family response regulator
VKEPRILVVDDDASATRYASLTLERAGYRVVEAAGGLSGLRAVERERPALVIADLQMPDMNGLELLACIRERWPGLPVMLLTVDGEVATVVQAVQRGAVNYLIKPVAPAVLLAATARALAHAQPAPGASRAGSGDERETAGDIVGASAAILRVRHLVGLASRSDVNVIVVGETGSGKELVARAVHRLSGAVSGQPSRPFAAHNCAMTPADMFDSEFFGHLRGAFTGASRDRDGLLRAADGGTLFLDELECLSLPNQAKLLRVLDDGEVRPLGSDRPVPVSVRFLAATNREPRTMLAAGELREDLYYRLRGFEIRLPPLRERASDVPLLARHFLEGTGKYLTPAALDVLGRCSWPGNVRQLRTVLKVAASHCAGDAIEAGDLDLEIPGGAAVAGSVAPETGWALRESPRNAGTLEEIERQAIVSALEAHLGNRSRAARALGIHRSTLVRRLRELGIEPATKRR